MSALPQVVAREEPEDVEDAAPSRTDLRHLRIVVDLLKAHGLAVASAEVMRAVTEIELARPELDRHQTSLALVRQAVKAVDKAEATLNTKLQTWLAIDGSLLTKDQRMERREWEMALRQDVEYARKRLLVGVRLLVEPARDQLAPTPFEREERQMRRALEPSSPRDWLNPDPAE